MDKVDDIINIIKTELEYPTPNSPVMQRVFDSMQKAISEGNTEPYHPLQLFAQIITQKTKESLLKRINEYLKDIDHREGG